MNASTVVWIVVIAVIVIALLAVIAMMANKKKRERDRSQAAELREQAADKATEIQRREALAKETEAKAAAARAEADRKAAEAERLEADAHDRASAAAQHREEHQEHLRRADELDPDVKHSAPTTAPVDEHEGHDSPHDGSATGSAYDEAGTRTMGSNGATSHGATDSTGPETTAEGAHVGEHTHLEERTSETGETTGGSHRA